MTPSLKIAGIDLSIIGWLDYDQQIAPIGGTSVRRMASGAAFKMSRWRKYRVSISATGWIPPALLGIDYDVPFEIELPLPVALNAAETLPAGWSPRTAPWGEHVVIDQAGKSVRYVYPKMTVVAEPPSQGHSHGGTPSWELICEEI